MSQEIIAQIKQSIKSRLLRGSPFSSPSSAWQGCEQLATIDGISLTLDYISKDNLVRVRATTKTELLGSLELARRIGRGQYEVIADDVTIDSWLNTIWPQPETPTNGGNLLELARAEFASRSQWDSVATVTIWESGDKAAWLSRDSKGFIVLQLFKNHERLTKRRYSKVLPVGYWSPADSMWLECHELRENYPAWVQQARREVGV